MKITFLASSTLLIEVGNLKILTDPWLLDGEYYGSWAHYPEYDWNTCDLSDIDFIYVSHIHPDHLSRRTMAKLPKVPVFIHSYEGKFLKGNIERMGFEVIELPHNQRLEIAPGVGLNILAADDCDPEVCGKYLGCAPLHGNVGSMQIDSACVIDDHGQVLVNLNDCPYGLARHIMPRIRDYYDKVDLLLTGYSGAGPYPQCFSNLSTEQKLQAAERKKIQFLNSAVSYVRELNPRYILPFAGQYVLSGPLTHLNGLRGIPSLTEAKQYISERCPEGSKVILLMQGTQFDVATGKSSTDFVEATVQEMEQYQSEVLMSRTFDFFDDPATSESEIEALMREANARFQKHRARLGFSSETRLLVKVGDNSYADVPLSEKVEHKIIDKLPVDQGYVVVGTDQRLLARILKGPANAHWNNATIGSHVAFHRSPDQYDPAIYTTLNYLHS